MTSTTTKDLNVAVIVKLEPDFSEGNVSYNADGTLNRAETKSILGPHSAIASNAAFYAKVKYGARVAVGTMGPPIAESALQQAQTRSAMQTNFICIAIGSLLVPTRLLPPKC